MGDMHPQPSIYVSCGIIRVHISFGITGNCRYIRSEQRYAVILSVSEESDAEAGAGTPSGTPDPSLRLRFVYGDNTAASSMVTRNVFLSVAKNLEKKGRATDREHVTFVSY